MIRTRVSRAALGTPMECPELRCDMVGGMAGALAPSAAADSIAPAPTDARGDGHVAVSGSGLPQLPPIPIDNPRMPRLPQQKTLRAALRRTALQPPMHATPTAVAATRWPAHPRTPPIHPQ